jgi:nucleoside-diphosphate-sugar epimerase
MQTIIGAGGGIGIPLVKELVKFTKQIRLVSRNPKKFNETDELFPADLSDLSQIDRVVAGSEVVYIVIGFEYNIQVWRKVWPPFLQAVIDACIKHQAKMVFLDNVYMYAESEIPYMTESATVQPSSKKGVVRKQLQDMILDAIKNQGLKALIARSADFYGPDNKNSSLNIMVVDNFKKGKKAQVFGDIDKIHTYTYTPDAAKAVALLGNTDDAYGQVWHLPTTKEKLTNRQWIQLIGDEMKVEPRVQPVPIWMLKMLGLFIPIMREFPEMIYQNDRDYVFDSSKFEKRFGLEAIAPKEGIKKLIESLKS